MVVLICGKTSFSQTIDKAILPLLNASSQQKIYVQYDRKVYESGDTIWFKAYLFNGLSRSKSSKNFYFELITYDGQLIGRSVTPIFESTSSGNLVIPTLAQQTVCIAGPIRQRVLLPTPICNILMHFLI